jgi:hypothetical protein
MRCLLCFHAFYNINQSHHGTARGLLTVQERAKATGRVVPQETLERALREVPDAVKILAPKSDFFCELYNGDTGDGIQIITPHMTWETFATIWSSVVAPPAPPSPAANLTHLFSRL